VKLRHLSLFFILILTCQGWAQLKEPTSDPSFNTAAATTEDMDDAADVKLRPSPQKYVEQDEDAPKAPSKSPSPNISSQDSELSVKRVRINAANGSGGGTPRSIQLVTPQHNSTYTPGVITFSWKLALPTKSKKKRYVILKVERLDGKKKYSRRIFKEKKLLDLSPGDYKWQVAIDKSTQESRWRLFKIIGMKSHSVTDLYNGSGPTAKKASPSTKKNLPEVSDYIIDLDGPDEEDVRIPASAPLPLLPAPDWIRQH